MLVRNTQVRIAQNGKTVPVESLSIADKVYDAATGTYDEIVDILARTLDYHRAARIGLHPIRLAKDALRAGYPTDETHVSPNQGVLLVAHGPCNSVYKHLVERRASDLTAAQPVAAWDKLTYFCVFFARKRYLQVNGLRLSAYTLEDIIHARP